MFTILEEVSGGSELEELSRKQSSQNSNMCFWFHCTHNFKIFLIEMLRYVPTLNPASLKWISVNMTKYIHHKSIHPETEYIFLKFVLLEYIKIVLIEVFVSSLAFK